MGARRWVAAACLAAVACAGGGAAQRGAPPVAATAAPAATEPPAELPEPTFGSPEDRALWRELKTATSDAVLNLARISQCAYRIRYAHPYEELDARAADPALADEAKALRTRLAAAAEAAQAAVPADGGRAHACRYALLHLEQAMEFPDEPAMREDAARRRDEARQCADRMSALVAAARPRADELEATLAAVDAFVARTPRAQPAQAATPSAAPENAR